MLEWVWCTSRTAEDRTGRQGTAYIERPSPINNAANFIVDRAGFWFHGDRTPTSPRFFCFTASLNPLPSSPPVSPFNRYPPYILRYFEKPIKTRLSGYTMTVWKERGRTQHADLREANLQPKLWENNRIRVNLDCNVMTNKSNVNSIYISQHA